jgi:hypothetical protein
MSTTTRKQDDMSITAIGSGQTPLAQQVQAAQHHGGGHSGARKAGMDAAAKALGMSSTDVQTALKSGQSLTSLAQSKGVSTGTLSDAISDALTQANPSLSGARAQQITQRLIQGPGAGGASSTASVDRDHDGDSH